MSEGGPEPLYYVIGPDKRRYGPHPIHLLREWRRDRRIGSDSPTCQAGDSEWRTLRDFPELYGATPPPTPVAPKPPPVPVMSVRDAEIAIPNHAIAAALFSLIGCPPLGLVALYHSHQVGVRVRKGDIDGAWSSSRQARIWCWIALLTGVASWLAMGEFLKSLGLS